MQITDPIFERFLQPGDRGPATADLAGRGASALPILQSLFDGTAVNRYGVAYRRLGPPLDCALVVAGQLGPLARPLEPFLRAELRSGHPYAAQTLGALCVLDEDSVVALAEAIGGTDIMMAMEAAASLVRCGALEHPAVKAAVDASATAAKVLRAAMRT